jgi:hypothetical protein
VLASTWERLVAQIQRWLYPASNLAKTNQSLVISPADACESDLVAVLQECPLLVTDLERILPAFGSLK